MSFLSEGFLYSFAFYLFSVTNVFPDYVSRLSDNPIVLSLLSILFYGPNYLASIISCWLSMNSLASPKKLGVLVCLSQRVGLILITLSSFMIGKASVPVCLVCFFVSYLLFNIADGVSAPTYFYMASTMIHKNIGTFFGAYNMVGSISGVLASLLLTYLYNVRTYPSNYQLMFSIGVVFALAASSAVAFGAREYKEEKKTEEKVRWRELPAMMKKSVTGNSLFRYYVLIYVILGAAEFAMPLYSVRLAQQKDLPDYFIGMMSLISLVASIAANWIWGRLSDRKGLFWVLALSSACGIAAAGLTILNYGGVLNYLAYLLLAFASAGCYITNNVACTVYAEDGNSTILTAASKLCAAPICILASVGSGMLAQLTSITVVFVLALTSYIVCTILSLRKIKL
ncbi:MAG: MFS transporter [Oscillospiraceae bacterium]|nr:MFS transporter [Oscillospiraceae bacterium]